jgi:Na+-driven multidrug efflux pump
MRLQTSLFLTPLFGFPCYLLLWTILNETIYLVNNSVAIVQVCGQQMIWLFWGYVFFFFFKQMDEFIKKRTRQVFTPVKPFRKTKHTDFTFTILWLKNYS